MSNIMDELYEPEEKKKGSETLENEPIEENKEQIGWSQVSMIETFFIAATIGIVFIFLKSGGANIPSILLPVVTAIAIVSYMALKNLK